MNAAPNDTPVAPERVDLARVVASLREAYGDAVVAVLASDAARPASWARLEDAGLCDAARDAVARRLGPPARLYSHQRDAIAALLAGRSVVVATATASGKSLCFQAPVLHDAATAPQGEAPAALYLAPLNALVDDQFRAFAAFDAGGGGAAPGAARGRAEALGYASVVRVGDRAILAAQYHGGVRDGDDERATSELRREVRARRPDVLFTNPEMLARAILPLALDVRVPGAPRKPGGGQWAHFFRRLRYVVLDECHELRGVHGAHVANLLRRVRRACALAGNDAPLRYALCSATIRDPGGLAARVTGAPDVVAFGAADDGSERHAKALVFVRRPREDVPLRAFAADVLARLVGREGLATIAFQESVADVQSLGRDVAAALAGAGEGGGACDVFAATFLPGEKAARLEAMRSGRVRGVVATSALALGLDVGSLGCAALVSYPGTIAKAWQMLGRAGRRGPGLQLFVLGDSFLDRYWAERPAEFLDRERHLEEVIVAPDNPWVLREHVLAAHYDAPLDPPRDAAFFGEGFRPALDALVAEGALARAAGEGGAREEYAFRDGVSARRPFGFPLRGTGGSKVVVRLEHPEGRALLEEDCQRAARTLHPGAVFLHAGEFFEVVGAFPSRDARAGRRACVVVRRAPAGEVTVPVVTTSIAAREVVARRGVGRGEVAAVAGRVAVATRVDHYFVVASDAAPRGAGAEVALDDDALGRADGARMRRVRRDARAGLVAGDYEADAAWLVVPRRATAGVAGAAALARGLFTVGKALAQAIPLAHYAAADDLAFTSFATHAAAEGAGAVFVYERCEGGIGLAARTYELLPELLRVALSEVLDGCARCARSAGSRGCPACVADASGLHDRDLARALLRAWL